MAAGVDISTGVSLVSAVIIGVGAFAAAFVIVLWLGRGIHSHVVLHGFLMGLAATLLYLGLVAGSGQMSSALAAYGPSAIHRRSWIFMESLCWRGVPPAPGRLFV